MLARGRGIDRYSDTCNDAMITREVGCVTDVTLREKER
jgi:hypothetical protein